MLRRPSLHTAMVCVSFVAAAAALQYELPLATPQSGYLFDFGGFITSARAALQGLNPYGAYQGVPVYFWNGQMSYGVNLNPPITVLAFVPLAHLDETVTYLVWYVASFLMYAAALVVLARAYPEHDWKTRVPWALSIWGLWNTLLLGQVYTFLAALTIGAWVLQKQRKPILAGVLIGILVAIKPNFAVWPVLLFIAGQRRSALTAVAAAGVLSLLPLVAYGRGVYVEWLAVIGSNALLTYPANGSILAGATRLGIPTAGTALSAVLMVAIAAYVWRARPGALAVSALALIASLLASPIAWAGYLLVLMPIFFSRSWSIPLIAVAALWMLPEYVIVGEFRDSGWRFWVFGFAYLAGLALIFGVVARDAFKRRRGLKTCPPRTSPALFPPAVSTILQSNA